MQRTLLFHGSMLIVLLCGGASAKLHKYLAANTSRDTLFHVWVVFEDKPGNQGGAVATPRALNRRRAASFTGGRWADRPVSRDYIERVTRLGARPRQVFKWANAASFAVHASRLEAIDALACVNAVTPVARYTRAPGVARRSLHKKNAEPAGPGLYGGALDQLAMIGIVQAHSYLHETAGEEPGEGLLIGVFDTGFLLGHPCFGRLRESGAVVSDSDFVQGDGDVSDPAEENSHGTTVLGLIAGHDPGRFMGAAWGARFLLARTENDPVEMHIEEDNWAAAMVWAESLGVDIVNSSLGYRDGFTDSLGNPRSEDDYRYGDLDGKTTIIARAAAAAAERGVLIVNAMGNEGTWTSGTITSPADVEDVIAVGMVDEHRKISSQSSTGPTADGRIKPDLVAQGMAVIIPDLYSSGGYGPYGSGTSFSSPLVAGLVALVKQANPGAQASRIREIVYHSCAYSPFQDTVDNQYGRGIPDAFAALLDDSRFYLSIVDSLDRFIYGARVYRGETELGVSDSFGVVTLATGDVAHADTLRVVHEEYNEAVIVRDQTRKKQTAHLKSGYTVIVAVTNNFDDTLQNAAVYWRADSAESFQRLSNEYGEIYLTVQDTGMYYLYATAARHFASDTIAFRVSGDSLIAPVQLERWRSVLIRVTDSLGVPLESGTLTYRRTGASSYTSTPVADGEASLWYDIPGAFIVQIRASGYHDTEPREIAAAPDNEQVRIVIRKRTSTVIKLIASGSAPQRATVTWRRDSAVTSRSAAVDSSGVRRIAFDEDGDYALTVSAPGFRLQGDTLWVSTSTIADTTSLILIAQLRQLHVVLTDTSRQRLRSGTVFVRGVAEERYRSYAVDSTGSVTIDTWDRGGSTLYASSFGYRPSGEITVGESSATDTLEIGLHRRAITTLSVYPNVVSARRLEANERLGITVEFIAGADDPARHSQLCRIAVRSLDGSLVWEYATYAVQYQEVTDATGNALRWNGRTRDNAVVSPGTYLVTVVYAGKRYMKKILISG